MILCIYKTDIVNRFFITYESELYESENHFCGVQLSIKHVH